MCLNISTRETVVMTSANANETEWISEKLNPLFTTKFLRWRRDILTMYMVVFNATFILRLLLHVYIVTAA